MVEALAKLLMCNFRPNNGYSTLSVQLSGIMHQTEAFA